MKVNLPLLVTGVVSFFWGLTMGVWQKGNCTERSIELIQPPNSQPLFKFPTTPSPSLNDEQLHQYARSITVKVFSGQNSGSGILIAYQNQVYTVVTNQHVILFGQGKDYKIQTPDGQIYQAKLVKSDQFKQQDLGLLEFRSQKPYQVVSLSANITPILGETILAAGFPFDTSTAQSSGFLLLNGKINAINTQPFGGGYQIGYNSTVKKGMSGGPLLNLQGQVIGINGIHQYPLWGNPYLFQDGRLASSEEQEWMSQLSWAIPVQTFLKLAPQFSDQKPSPSAIFPRW